VPLALLILGALFLTAAVRGDKCGGRQCADVLFQTMKDDFTGPGNFIYWGLALFLIGALGYYKPMKPLSNAFLGLVILVLFISNRGFFAKFLEQIGSTQAVQSQPIGADLGSGLFNIVSGSGSGNGNSQSNSIWDQYKSAVPDSALSIAAKIFKF
jgi:hypothetical protein